MQPCFCLFVCFFTWIFTGLSGLNVLFCNAMQYCILHNFSFRLMVYKQQLIIHRCQTQSHWAEDHFLFKKRKEYQWTKTFTLKMICNVQPCNLLSSVTDFFLSGFCANAAAYKRIKWWFNNKWIKYSPFLGHMKGTVFIQCIGNSEQSQICRKRKLALF